MGGCLRVKLEGDYLIWHTNGKAVFLPDPESIERFQLVEWQSATPLTQTQASVRWQELEAQFPNQFFCVMLAPKKPMQLKVDPEWLIKMAEKENGCIISVGGVLSLE